MTGSPPLPEGVDARRYVWCHSQAVWTLGALLPMLREDVDGAEADHQPRLLRYVARLIVEYCATAVYLVEQHPRPLPPTSVRAVVALQAMRDSPLRASLLRILHGPGDDIAALAGLCRQVIDRTIEIIGPVPDLIDPAKRVQALGHARDWITLIERIGDGGGEYLPELPRTQGRP